MYSIMSIVTRRPIRWISWGLWNERGIRDAGWRRSRGAEGAEDFGSTGWLTEGDGPAVEETWFISEGNSTTERRVYETEISLGICGLRCFKGRVGTRFFNVAGVRVRGGFNGERDSLGTCRDERREHEGLGRYSPKHLSERRGAKGRGE
jgi:hypothetical protein